MPLEYLQHPPARSFGSHGARVPGKSACNKMQQRLQRVRDAKAAVEKGERARARNCALALARAHAHARRIERVPHSVDWCAVVRAHAPFDLRAPAPAQGRALLRAHAWGERRGRAEGEEAGREGRVVGRERQRVWFVFGSRSAG